MLTPNSVEITEAGLFVLFKHKNCAVVIFHWHLLVSKYRLLYYKLQQKTHKESIMKTEMISVRVDHGTKLEFTHICEEIGLSPSQAIKLFAKAVINHGGIPFELKKRAPNKITLQAIQELENGKGHKVHTTTELFDELGVELDND